MSRCFPYPPPGYATQHKADCMIESLKLQKVKKAKKERKEKKQDKKQKEKTWGCGEIDKKKHKDKRRHKDKRHQDDGSGQQHQKRRENESEHLENSSLTEEHGHPVGSQNSCDSCGSTPNHNKKHKTSSFYNGRENSGSTIKFLLPCETHKDERTGRLGSAPGKLIQGGNFGACCKPFGEAKASSTLATDSRHVIPRPVSAGASEMCPQNLNADPPSIHSGDSPYELKFRNLFENWLPPPTCSAIPECDDQEWLFTPKQKHNRGTKRIRAVADRSSYKCCAPWSRACHLPEVDLYALPFTVPF